MTYFATIIERWDATTVLDLGCGGGFMSEALAQQGARIIGVDPSEPAIQAARSHAAEQGFEIDYRVGAGERIPLDDNAVDCVVCVDVLEHVEDLDQVIREIRRVLKPGGSLLFDTINRTWLAKVVLVFFGETVLRLLPRGTHDSAKFIRPSELQAKLRGEGLSMGPLVGLGPCGLNRRLDFTFCKLPSISIMYMGHARLQPQSKDDAPPFL